MVKNYPLGLLLLSLPVTGLIYAGVMMQEWLGGKFQLGLTRLTAIGWVMLNLLVLIKERSWIRRSTNPKRDVAILNLFAPVNLLGKTRLVLFDSPKTRQV